MTEGGGGVQGIWICPPPSPFWADFVPRPSSEFYILWLHFTRQGFIYKISQGGGGGGG